MNQPKHESEALKMMITTFFRCNKNLRWKISSVDAELIFSLMEKLYRLQQFGKVRKNIFFLQALLKTQLADLQWALNKQEKKNLIFISAKNYEKIQYSEEKTKVFFDRTMKILKIRSKNKKNVKLNFGSSQK